MRARFYALAPILSSVFFSKLPEKTCSCERPAPPRACRDPDAHRAGASPQSAGAGVGTKCRLQSQGRTGILVSSVSRSAGLPGGAKNMTEDLCSVASDSKRAIGSHVK